MQGALIQLFIITDRRSVNDPFFDMPSIGETDITSTDKTADFEFSNNGETVTFTQYQEEVTTVSGGIETTAIISSTFVMNKL